MASSPRVAVAATVKAWLEGLTFTPGAGGSPFGLQWVEVFPAMPQATLESYPGALVIVDGTLEPRHTEEVSSTRDPSEGDGTIVERLGDFSGTCRIVLYTTGWQQLDDVEGGLLSALRTQDDGHGEYDGTRYEDITGKKRLDATSYYVAAAFVVLHAEDMIQVQLRDAQDRMLMKPAIVCRVGIPWLRSRAAADLQPQIGLTVDDDGEYTLDLVAETTTPP